MILLSSLMVEASPIDSLQAAIVATNHFKLHADQFSGIEFAYKQQAAGTKDVLYYVFNHKNDKGFVMVVADDASVPILGYSLESKFSTDNQPPAFTAMLDNRAKEINYIKEKQLVATESIKMQWQNLMKLNPNTMEVEKRGEPVGPLLTTTWNQAPYYNDKCPKNAQGQAVTGCVATAMAQIMNYWKYPKTGIGSHSYTSANYGTLQANFATTYYDWANMPTSLNASSSVASINAVSTLMSHCGISVDMNYSVSGSGAFTYLMAQSLKTYFGYDQAVTEVSRNGRSDAEWIDILTKQLDARLPMEYSGFGSGSNAPGHSFVCDGYDAAGKFHFNWGWGKSYDGYFAINALNPDGQHDYTQKQQVVINIKPATKAVAYTMSVTSPNAGAKLIGNTSTNITWTSNVTGNVKLEILKGGVYVASTTIANSGTFNWSVPNNWIDGNDYAVRISSVDMPSVTATGGLFSINKAVVYTMTILSPKAGDKFIGNTNMSIKWSSNVTGDVKIDILKSGVVMASSILGNTGSASWLVPNIDANDYAVRISSVDMPSVTATSGLFTIVKAATTNLQFSKPLVVNPIAALVGKPISITFGVTNLSTAIFQGTLAVSLYDKNGNFIQYIANTPVQLGSNMPINYAYNTILSNAPGDYLIGVAAFNPATQLWSNVGTSIRIVLTKPAALAANVVSVIQNDNEKDQVVTTRANNTAQNEAFSTNTQAYPNPTKGELTIETPNDATIKQMLLMDVTGKVLQNINEPSNHFTMDLSPYQAGIYLLHITSDKGITTKKISVVK
jgi:Peptidase C10 family/Spi protease inhibitor/Secretion system C-terminal sorting domain